jgi:group II intron reverse transcriptase/maturase
MRKADYAVGLEDRLQGLSQQIRRMAYRPKPVRRVYIPKGEGKVRPLGIPSFEDRLVQDRLSQVLQSIWEPEFLDCSYGFRPGRNAHDALRRIGWVITREHTQWVVEADIMGFFDHVSHDHMMRFLECRIVDPLFLRLIKRFLKAGIMTDGAVEASEQGTPQGGLVSPVLANIYLHYVLDLWFEKRFMKTCRGRAFLVRYADDFVGCFTHEEDAKAFLQGLTERLSAFSLEIEAAKTALLRFGDREDGQKRPPTFNFLGFTHYAGKSRAGRFVVARKTEGRRVRKKLRQVKEMLRVLRVKGGKAMMQYVVRHLNGHLQYYGVSGNFPSLRSYCLQVHRQLCKWLNRRSQSRSITWESFCARVVPQLPRPRIIHNLYPGSATRTGSRMV